MSKRIAITGLGAISGLGLNVSDFWAGLSSGRTAIKPLVGVNEGTKISVGAVVPNYDPSQHFSSDDLSLLDRFSQFALLAGREAITDSGLVPGNAAITNAAAIIGTGGGGWETAEETYVQLYKRQRTRVHPLTVPKGMASAAASMISMHLGIKGPVFSVTSACASGAHAAVQGSMMIQSGLVDVALVGGSEAPFTYGLLKAWEALRVVSSDTCRPFCNNRSGMVLGEGAGMLVMESEEHAKQRGARIYAELAGCGMSSDAGHITRPDIDGLTVAISSAIQNAGLVPSDVDYVNAHGTATPANDPAETAALNKVFGSRARSLPVSSTKSMHAHPLGAVSALELVATVLTIHNNCIPPTANFTEADEKCDLDYVPNYAREQQVGVALSNSFAFGGMNVVLALKSI